MGQLPDLLYLGENMQPRHWSSVRTAAREIKNVMFLTTSERLVDVVRYKQMPKFEKFTVLFDK